MRRDPQVEESFIELQKEIGAVLSRNASGKPGCSFQTLTAKIGQSNALRVGEAVNTALGPQTPVSPQLPSDSCATTSSSLAPGTPSRVRAAFSAFFEHSGVVLLEPEVPKAEQLVTKYVPALDRFLIASRINIAEDVSEADDPRKFRFISRIRDMRNRFRDECTALVCVARQLGDALRLLLEKQAQVRPVSKDEHVLKAIWIHERFDKLLDKMLTVTRDTIVALQKNFLAPYDADATKREVRTQRVFNMGEDALRVEASLNPNIVSAKKLARRKPTTQIVVDTSALDEQDDSYVESQPQQRLAPSLRTSARQDQGSVFPLQNASEGDEPKFQTRVKHERAWSEEDSTQGSVEVRNRAAAAAAAAAAASGVAGGPGASPGADSEGTHHADGRSNSSGSGGPSPVAPSFVLLKKQRTDSGPTATAPMSLNSSFSNFVLPMLLDTDADMFMQDFEVPPMEPFEQFQLAL